MYNYFIERFFFYIGIGSLNDTVDKSVSIKYRIIDPTIVRAELVIRFLEMNTTIDNIHLSIEV